MELAHKPHKNNKDYKVMLFAAHKPNNSNTVDDQRLAASLKEYAAPVKLDSDVATTIMDSVGVDKQVFGHWWAVSNATVESKTIKIAKEWSEAFYLANPDVNFKTICLQIHLVTKTFSSETTISEEELRLFLKNAPELSDVSWRLYDIQTPPSGSKGLVYRFRVEGCNEQSQKAGQVFSKWWENNTSEMCLHYKELITCIFAGSHYEQKEKNLTRVAGKQPTVIKKRV